ncbi:pyridoxal phosphate-dependent aminotransferase [Candidatus Micrarchaeota archaeon]|nr:pyridoxal phosphate-dependent aminotransferase [Candidatus Micrarchaeota archaeon]
MKKDSFSFLAEIALLAEKKQIINMAVGEPNLKLPETVTESLAKNFSLSQNYSSPEGIPELRKLIQKKLKTENKIKAEKTVITNGAIEAIFDLLLAHLKQGSELLLFSPYYSKYNMVPLLNNCKVKKIPFQKNRPDFELLEKTISNKSKVILLNSPHNPTGTVFNKEEIKELVEITEKHSLILISDEVYEKFVYEGKKHISPARFSSDVIIVNSFSKTFSMPSLRLGFMTGPEDLINPALKIHLCNVSCTSSISQNIGIKLLKKCKNFPDLSELNNKRKFVIKTLQENNIDFIFPEGTFYIYIFTKKNSNNIFNKLKRNGVLIMPNKIFGNNKNAIRISYSIPQEELEKAIAVIIKTIKGD